MKVLLAIDGSPHSDIAVSEVAARPWPKATRIEILTVVHAAIPLALDPAFAIAAAHVEQLQAQRRHASSILETATEHIRRHAPDLTVTAKVLEADPKHAIVQEAADWGADLIVVGSHGYGRLRRMVLGSVAGAVVANAPCSVHVAREKHAAEPAAA
jgi:nucleotide-binding universal stress UspA family protein